ncbi:hypothetical protein SAMN06272771_4735 [Streptomyces sp. Ag82_O1-12]|uniref:hypothetical protein n=1 Tax=unclassified Streptomyces TaxID=2593676 RepID=UPI000BD7BC80|nr:MULTISPECIES: hypothetical protein [unclassified Streptomyces]SMQ18288.1 hypothetical protein SAMN06272771_4735 [Streptomyces sp. Ag82_O1-12]SOD47324.1 hypothetical protein SAMN06272727_4735 [Streptomyces sp. Ag82_G6-1]
MVDVSAELGQLSELDELTGPAVAAVLDASGWEGERRNRAKEWATTWRRDDAHAWIQGDGPVEVEFTLWYREVEDERPDPDTYIDELYDLASAELPRVVAQLESGVLGARIEAVDEDLTDGADYIDHTAWRIADKVLLAGVKHDDTDAPVQLVVVMRGYGTGEQDDAGEWL